MKIRSNLNLLTKKVETVLLMVASSFFSTIQTRAFKYVRTSSVQATTSATSANGRLTRLDLGCLAYFFAVRCNVSLSTFLHTNFIVLYLD